MTSHPTKSEKYPELRLKLGKCTFNDETLDKNGRRYSPKHWAEIPWSNYLRWCLGEWNKNCQREALFVMHPFEIKWHSSSCSFPQIQIIVGVSSSQLHKIGQPETLNDVWIRELNLRNNRLEVKVLNTCYRLKMLKFWPVWSSITTK